MPGEGLWKLGGGGGVTSNKGECWFFLPPSGEVEVLFWSGGGGELFFSNQG